MKQKTIVTILVVIAGLLWGFVGTNAADEGEVYQCQKRLVELGYDPGPLDGIWGSKTEEAVKEFQKDNNLPISGFLDDNTKRKLGLQDEKDEIKADPAGPDEVDKFLDDFEETHRQLVFSYDSYKHYGQDVYLAGVYTSEENYRLATSKWEKMYSEVASEAQKVRYSLISRRLNNDIDRIKQETYMRTPNELASAFAYTIHLESFRDSWKAQERVRSLRSLGLDAFSSRVDLPEKGTYYRVFVGRFEDREQAREFQAKLKSDYELSKGIIMPAPF
jgi:peptidoglycan hydrolase-like protein with peptidoglycan-binding domain